MFTVLPLSEDPRQVFTVDLPLGESPLHARAEIRYLEILDQWVLSLWDNSDGELLVNQIPLVCSYEQVNDLLAPFRHLRSGQGLGALYVIRDVDRPDTENPAGGTLTQFKIIIGVWDE